MKRRRPIPATTRASLVAASLLAAGLGCACAEPGAPAPARRVLLITCDTLRADRLGAYGYPREVTPNLDALADEAVVFERAFSSASSTVPAVSSLLTGRLPDELGVSGGNQTLMHPAALTLAEAASGAGLATGAVVSNWVLRRQPGRAAAGVTQGFGHFDDRVDTLESSRRVPERLAPDTARAALEWLRDRERLGEDRFLLWVHFQDPHGPYTPPADVLEPFLRAPADGERRLPIGDSTSGRGQIPDYQALDGEDRAAAYVDRYDAEIRYFDDALGRLLDQVRELGWWDDTLILFTSDHGESLGEDDYWFSHGQHLGDEVVRVPLIVRFPGAAGVPQPARRSEVASHLDVFPTVLEMLGLPAPEARGLSLTSPLPANRRLLQTRGERGTRRRFTALIEGDRRLVVSPGENEPSLFDISGLDAPEVEVTDREPERLDQLLRGIRQLEAEVVAAPHTIRREPNRRDEELLRALGYTGAD